MDLTTQYLGFELPHPFMAGAGPLSDTLDSVRRLEDAGSAAIILRSLFEEQISTEALATQQATETYADSSGEALSYFPEPEDFVLGPDEYLEHLRRIKEAVQVPVIASLSGVTLGGWLDHAKLLEQAGSDALELNIYDVPMTLEEDSASIERQKVEMVAAVKKAVNIPVAVKLSRIFTSLAHFTRNLVAGGADGLVLFNRFYQPDIDTEELEYRSCLELSTSSELRLRLRWLAILSAQIQTSYAVTGGVHTCQDAVKAIMCGAEGVQMVSALFRYGLQYLRTIRQEISAWLEEHEYDSLAQMRGSMNLDRCPDPKMLYRVNYIHLLQTWEPS